MARVFVLALLAGLALGSPSVKSVHEKRAHDPVGWSRVRRHALDAVLPLRFGLAQSNMDKLEQLLLDVSQPDSPNYGNHWSAAQVAKTFAPSKDTVDTITAWLAESGISADRMRHAGSKSWIEVNATVEEAEKLLDTEYHVYVHNSGKEHIACDAYHLPKHVAPHIDIITPSVHFDSKRTGSAELTKRMGGNKPGTSIGKPDYGAVTPKYAGAVDIKSIVDELENCNTHITPNCLRALYGVVYKPIAAKKNSYGIVEYTPQAYLPTDLDMFFKNFSANLVGARPITDLIDGAIVQDIVESFDYNGESDLDLQYGYALAQTTPITLYQVGDIVEGASFNNFLDAIDGSFCTFEGGDDPDQDGVYPDPYGTADEGAYQGPEDCGTVKPTYVISTSYAYDEADLSPAYEARQCAEYAKLGLMGVSVLYSSGDHGVGGNGGYCLNPDGTQTADGTIFNPSFPGTCPYITSVGATQISPGASVLAPETACYETIYSGGGFANNFQVPDYQKSAVAAYLKDYPPPYSAAQYNTSGTSRGYPDIAANGANYVVAVDGAFGRVFGTSASAPVIGALLALVNDARLAIGKKPIGFINPTIYSSSFKAAFHDIVNGTNPGCGTLGFNATKGWDPVTGLGTPNFPVLLAKYLLLP